MQKAFLLIQRLTTGECNSPSFPYNAPLPLNDADIFLLGQFPLGEGQRAGGTTFDAVTAKDTGPSVNFVLVRKNMNTTGATLALTAVGAFCLLENQNSLAALGFRIMAPGTAQGTAGKEDRSADAGAVVDGKGLYVCNINCHFHPQIAEIFRAITSS